MKEYTKDRFVADLKASIERNKRVDARTVANNTRTSIAEVQSWLDGKTMPEPNVFGRMCATLYDLSHWRPHYRQVYQADLLQQKKAELAPDGQVLVAFRRPRKPEPEPEPEPEPDAAFEERRQAVAAEEDRPVGVEPWGAKMRRLRTAAGFSRADLAALAGVTESAVQFWEAGRAAPTGERRQAILELWPDLAGDLPLDESGDRVKPGPRAPRARVVPAIADEESVDAREPEPPPTAPPPVPQPPPAVRVKPSRGTKTAAIASGMAWAKLLAKVEREGGLEVLGEVLARAESDGMTIADVVNLVAEYR